MPRYRFRWDALPPAVLTGLAHDLVNGDADPAVSLRRAFGARPRDDFVRRAWPTLLEHWLADDPAARRSVTDALRDRRLGDYDASAGSKEDQLAYLRSCRNSTTLRSVVLREFLAFGERQAAVRREDTPSVHGTESAGGDEVDRKVADAWDTLADNLAQALAALKPGSHLVIELDEGGRRPTNQPTGYVEFAREADRLRAEAVSTARGSDAGGFEEAAQARLVAMGWNAPGDATSPSYWREGSPADGQLLAVLAVATLRDAFGAPHPAFLHYRAFDSAADLALPELGVESGSAAGPSTPAPPELQRPQSREELQAAVRTALSGVLGSMDVAVDNDGDFPIRYGTAMVFIRVAPNQPVVDVFSPLVRDIAPTDGLLHRLNELNQQVLGARLSYGGGAVVATMQLPGTPFVPEHLEWALRVMGDLADNLDEQLQREFGGQLFSAPPKQPPAGMSGGYL